MQKQTQSPGFAKGRNPAVLPSESRRRSDASFPCSKGDAGGGGNLIAVEAKSGSTFTDTWCKGLRAVAELRGLSRRIIVYPCGPALRTEDGIEVFPFQEFFDLLAANSL